MKDGYAVDFCIFDYGMAHQFVTGRSSEVNIYDRHFTLFVPLGAAIRWHVMEGKFPNYEFYNIVHNSTDKIQ